MSETAIKEYKTESRQEKHIKDFNSAKNSSVYLIPFYKKNIKEYSLGLLSQDNSAWQKAVLDYKYLANHVKTIIDGNSSFTSVIELNNDRRNLLGIPSRSNPVTLESHLSGNSKQKTDFFIDNIRIFCFSTDMGIMAIYVNYDPATTLEEIVEFNASFVRFINPKSDGIPEFYLEEQKYNLYEAICNILDIDSASTDCDSDNALFPSFSYRKCYSYHTLKTDRTEGDTESLRLQLMKGILSPGITNSLDGTNEIFYHQTPEVTRNLSSSGAVYVWHGKENFKKTIYNNSLKGYFLLYVLAVQERETLLKYHNIIVSKSDNIKELSKVRKKLMENSIKYSYSIVSNEVNYQHFYEQLSQCMHLPTLLNEIQEVTERVDDYSRGEKDGRMNALLASIGILAIISALTDGVAFVQYCISSHLGRDAGTDISNGPYYFMYSIIIIIVLLGILLYFDKVDTLIDYSKKKPGMIILLVLLIIVAVTVFTLCPM